MNKMQLPLRKVGLSALVAATGLAVWLTLQSHGAVAGCAQECSEVLGSTWSRLGPVPVSLAGAVLYFSLTAALLLKLDRTAPGRWVVRAAGAAAVVSAVWFMGVQVLVLKAFCPWCTAIHALAVAGWWLTRPPGTPAPTDDSPEAAMAVLDARTEAWFAWAAAGAGVLTVAGVQILLEPTGWRSAVAEGRAASAVEADASSAQSVLSLHGGAVLLPTGDLPRLGSVTAPHVLVAVVDPTCPHCRELHGTLESLPRTLEGNVTVVFAPGFRDAEGRAIQRLLLALRRTDAAACAAIESALTAGRLPATLATIRAEADQRLGGAAKVDAALARHATAADSVLTATERLMRLNEGVTGENVLPQVMVGTRVLAGAWSSAEKYVQLAVEEFGMAPAVASRAPKAEVSAPLLDMGLLAPGERRVVRLAYRNVGGQPLVPELLSFFGPAAALPFRRDAVPPGATGVHEVEVTAPKTTGPFQLRAVLQANSEPAEAEWMLTGTVDPRRNPPPLELPQLSHSADAAPTPEQLQAITLPEGLK